MFDGTKLATQRISEHNEHDLYPQAVCLALADLDCLHALFGLLVPFPDRPLRLGVHAGLSLLRLVLKRRLLRSRHRSQGAPL